MTKRVMEIVQEVQIQTADGRKVVTTLTQQPQNPRLREYKWWLRVSLYVIFVLAGESAATLLGRLYYNKGGNSKWMASLVQSAGFPLLIIPFLYNFPVSSHAITFTNNNSNNNNDYNSSKKTKPKFFTLISLYLSFGLMITANDFMYSYGLLYLPLSTYALLSATQLAFSTLFSYFINSQKFTILIFNSTILLTMSASLLAINSEFDFNHSTKENHIIGFLCTLGASAAFALHHSLVQLSFEKVIKSETFSAVLDMQLYPCFVATCGCLVGLFASGEWRNLEKEMKGYKEGKVWYIMTLLGTGLTWQISSIGMLGLIFEVSSLFSIVIGTLQLPIVPVLAVVFFKDDINGVKIIALILALWGFISFMYQHYLDYKKAEADRSDDEGIEVENC